MILTSSLTAGRAAVRSLKPLTACLAVLFMLSGAQAWSQETEKQKLKASDGAAEDYFGLSVSVSGGLAVVGSMADDDMGLESGSAYVYRFDSGSGSWTEEAKLTASDGTDGDTFGASVCVSGDVILVGTPRDDDSGQNSGSVYVYRFDSGSGTWIEEAKLIASNGAAEDGFGGSLAASGEVILIGAEAGDGNSADSGAVYVFRHDAGSGTWIEEAILIASDGVSHDSFGIAVSLSGDAALIGAPNHDGVASGCGAAYVFRRDAGTGTWTEEQILQPSDGEMQDDFGVAVSVSGEAALIGAMGDDDMGIEAGSAYVFRFDGGAGAWIEEAKLTASDGGQDHIFGFAVALREDVALVTAPGDDPNGDFSGSTYLFGYDHVNGAWIEEYKMSDSDGAEMGVFGISIALNGNSILIGKPYDAENGSYSGAVYYFNLERPVAVDLKINGRDGSIVIDSNDSVTCKIEIEDNDDAGIPVDIWILAVRENVKGYSFGYHGSEAWLPGWNNVYFTGGLFDISVTVVDDFRPVRTGIWSLYLVIDGDPDGAISFAEILAYDAGSIMVIP